MMNLSLFFHTIIAAAGWRMTMLFCMTHICGHRSFVPLMGGWCLLGLKHCDNKSGGHDVAGAPLLYLQWYKFYDAPDVSIFSVWFCQSQKVGTWIIKRSSVLFDIHAMCCASIFLLDINIKPSQCESKWVFLKKLLEILFFMERLIDFGSTSINKLL